MGSATRVGVQTGGVRLGGGEGLARLGGGVGMGGEGDGEGSSLFGRGFHGDGAAMFLDDLAGDDQPQTRAAQAFSGEEGGVEALAPGPLATTLTRTAWAGPS